MNFVVAYLRLLMECCLGNMPPPLDEIWNFADISWKRALTSGTCGFLVHSAEPVKLVFDLGWMDVEP